MVTASNGENIIMTVTMFAIRQLCKHELKRQSLMSKTIQEKKTKTKGNKKKRNPRTTYSLTPICTYRYNNTSVARTHLLTEL